MTTETPMTEPRTCGRTDIVTTVQGNELLFRCDREFDHWRSDLRNGRRHHAINVEGVELFWEPTPAAALMPDAEAIAREYAALPASEPERGGTVVVPTRRAEPLSVEEEAELRRFMDKPYAVGRFYRDESIRRLLATLDAALSALEVSEAPLDAAWARAVAALPEGWALWGVRFRSPSTKRHRPRGQYEAWAGPIPVEGVPVAWPRPSRGLSGYSADTPAAALIALAAALPATERTETP